MTAARSSACLSRHLRHHFSGPSTVGGTGFASLQFGSGGSVRRRLSFGSSSFKVPKSRRQLKGGENSLQLGRFPVQIDRMLSSVLHRNLNNSAFGLAAFGILLQVAEVIRFWVLSENTLEHVALCNGCNDSSTPSSKRARLSLQDLLHFETLQSVIHNVGTVLRHPAILERIL